MKVLRTPNLSRIERYQGVVGKRMGEWVYVHRNYIDKLPAELVALVWKCERFNLLPEYSEVKVSTKKSIVVFQQSPDFDTADEPTSGEYCRVDYGSEIPAKIRRTRSLWHHKWLWVMDDYEDFNVEESFRRSKVWLEVADIDFKRIGNPKYWATIRERIL